jgi:signal transduction histidine kinase
MRFSERERISQDLHDGVIQTLYATGMMLEATIRRLDAESPIRDQLNFCIKSLNTSLLDLRHYITGLKDEDISRIPLKNVLENMLAEIEPKNRFQIKFSFQGDECLQLTPNRQNHLYYVLKELLNNIEKHTTSEQIHLKCEEETRDLVIHLWDNGQGKESSPQEFWIKKEGQCCQGYGMGLRNIRERVTILRGELSYSYPSTGGTLVILRIPKEVVL